jgi:hypothetical protein
MTEPFFIKKTNEFFWQHVKTFLVRNQYNEMLNFVVKNYFTKQYTVADKRPPFLNVNYCLTLTDFERQCGCNDMNASVNLLPKPAVQRPVNLLKERFSKLKNAN